MARTTMLLAVLFGVAALHAGEKSKPVELGKVEWVRDFDEAVKQAKASGKPILLLFQEVPG